MSIFLLTSLCIFFQITSVITGKHQSQEDGFYESTLSFPERDTGKVFMDSLTLEKVDGSNFKFSEVKGKVLLIDFWATWCKPCREQHPLVEKIYEDVNSENFEIITVSIDRDQKTWEKFLQTKDWKGINLYVGWKEANPLFQMIRDEIKLNNGKTVAKASVPQYFLVDKMLHVTKIVDITSPELIPEIKAMTQQ